jgi:hypothetical protein
MDKINMHEAINHDRRRFFGAAALTFAAAELGGTGTAHAETSPAPLSAIKPGANTSFAPLKQIDAGVLNVGYAEAGPSNGSPVILLPKRCVVGVDHAMDETHMHPARDQQSLALHHELKEGQGRPLGGSGLGEVTIDCVVGEAFNGFQVTARGKYWKVPMRMRLDATRVSMAPGNGGRGKQFRPLRRPPTPVWSESRAHAWLR